MSLACMDDVIILCAAILAQGMRSHLISFVPPTRTLIRWTFHPLSLCCGVLRFYPAWWVLEHLPLLPPSVS